MTPEPKIIDPALHDIFQAMMAYMGTTYVGMTCTTTNLPNMMSFSATLRLPNNDTWQYTETSTGPRISIAPPTATLGPGQTQQFTATITNADGTPATGMTPLWTVVGPGGGTINASGLYTAPATIPAATTQTITATVTGFGSSASITVNLQP